MSSTDPKSLLPAGLAEHVTTLSVKDGRAIAVVDAAGLNEHQRDEIKRLIDIRLLEYDDISDVRIVMTAERKQRRLIAIGSGKGGVGKSTLTANLAIALKKAGRAVGLVDADIYGPSQPVIFGNQGEKPIARDKKLVPIESSFGVPMLSMGHLVEPGRALAWRGPMAGNALSQLIDAHWGDVDTLLVDLPPGTGDVQMTLAQKAHVDGAIIVSTPQDVALLDARKGIDMFNQLKTPILGMIENMSTHICSNCGHEEHVFGHGGVAAEAEKLGVPLLAEIPLHLDIRVAADGGAPIVVSKPDSTQAEGFRKVAKALIAGGHA